MKLKTIRGQAIYEQMRIMMLNHVKLTSNNLKKLTTKRRIDVAQRIV